MTDVAYSEADGEFYTSPDAFIPSMDNILSRFQYDPQLINKQTLSLGTLALQGEPGDSLERVIIQNGQYSIQNYSITMVQKTGEDGIVHVYQTFKLNPNSTRPLNRSNDKWILSSEAQRNALVRVVKFSLEELL